MNSTAMTRRSLLHGFGGLGALGALGGLAACGGGNSGGSATGTVTFANWSDTYADLYTQVLDSFASSSGKTVSRQADVAFNDYQTRFRTLLSGGAPPDVMRLNDDFLREMTDKKQLLDITDRLSALDTTDFFPDLLDFTDLQSGRGGLVIGTQPRVIFYNKTVLQEAGITPPSTWTMDGWTWDTFLAAAQEVTTPDRSGAIVSLDTGYENTWAVNNGGPGIFSADGRTFTLADPEGVEAIQWVADLTVKHKVQPLWADLQPENADLSLFAGGRAAMLFRSMGTASYLRENVKDFEWDIAPVPGRVAQKQEGSMIVFVIPAKSRNPDDAFALLSALVAPEAGQTFASAGAFVPATRTAAAAVDQSATGGENVALFAAAVENSQAVNSTSATSRAVQFYRPQLERVYTGEITAEEALSGVRDQVEQALAAG